MKMTKQKMNILWLTILLSILLTSCESADNSALQPIRQADKNDKRVETNEEEIAAEEVDTFSIQDIPKYSGEPYVELNNNEPDFTYDNSKIESYESYGDLDSRGRCGVAESCIGSDLMPTEVRESIGQIKPSGWHTIKYDNIDGKFLYNRCHLFGYQLTGENANEKNLITGTRYMNTIGMLPFENRIADYIRETKNHVQHRVTPVFEGDNLVASGVQMEAKSVEDSGEGISYNVFVYNVQPGILINYATGESRASNDDSNSSENLTDSGDSDTSYETYTLNKNTRKYHKQDCSSVQSIKRENKSAHVGTDDELIKQGYDSCGNCEP